MDYVMGNFARATRLECETPRTSLLLGSRPTIMAVLAQ